MNKIPLIFSVLGIMAVLAVSGCTMPWGTTTTAAAGYGLVISDFYSSRDSVEGTGKTAKLSLEVENKGGSKILKDDYLACLMGSNFPGSTSSGMWGLATEVCKSGVDLSDLDGADPIRNIPGEVKTVSWSITSPYLEYPLSRTDAFTSRVFYKYKSRVATTVWIYNENELTAAKQRGETIPSSLTIEKTIGPVDISIEVTQPIVGESGEDFPIKVTVTNTGGGTVFDTGAIGWTEATTPSVSEANLNKLSLSVSSPFGHSDCDTSLGDIELRKGASVTMPCDLNIHEAIDTKKSYPLTITAEYGYYIESSLSVEAVGKRGEILDTTAPATITGLVAVAGTVSGTVVLTWTAPGDDGTTGTASQYDIRYYTSSITESNWGSATKVSGEPTPSAAGAAQTFTVTGLASGGTYYFAIKTADDVLNWSGVSNSPSAVPT